MNKYSSKAVKTAATVGMSLAMVLSAVSPVMAATESPVKPEVSVKVCTTGKDTDCKELFYDLSKAIDSIGLDELTLDSEATLGGTKNAKIVATILANRDSLSAYAEGDNYVTYKKWMDVIGVLFNSNGTGGKESNGMFSSSLYLEGQPQSFGNNTPFGLVNYYEQQLEKVWTEKALKDDASDAVEAYEKMNGWIADGYVDRLDDYLSEKFDEVYTLLEERVADYIVSDDEVTDLFVAAWSTVLEQDLDGKAGVSLDFGKNKSDFEKETGLKEASDKTIDLSKKSEIKGRIEAIKNSPNYYRVKNESAVEDIIAQYEALLDNITDLKDLLKDDSYKAFTTTKTDDAKATVKSVLSTFDKYDSKATDKENAEKLAKTLDVEQYEILKAMVEDVLNNAYNFETKQVGNYYVDKSDWVEGFTGQGTITRDLGKSDFLRELADTKEGLFGIDVVLNHLADFVKAWDAVTTDIEALTPANIKATDKATLEAAEDAYYEMTAEDGKYEGNLTKDQSKELRRVKTKIENLREAFDNLGTTTVAGWYDMGNGNWGYNNEDGTPAAYKWVASGSNWYFVKDGKMVRSSWLATDGGRWYYLDSEGKMVTNQSVDGCWINSYGVYMSPSYNG